MKVPHQVVGRTRPSSQPLAFRQEASADFSPIVRGLSSLGAELEAQQKKRDAFGQKKMLIEEETRSIFDLNERIEQAPLGAEDFARSTLADYEQRHNKLLGDMRAKGYDEEVIQDAELRLGRLRENLVTQSLKFESSSQLAKAQVDANDSVQGMAKAVSMVPSELEAGIEQVDELIDSMPEIDAIQREGLKEQAHATLRVAAGLGLAQQEPGTVTRLLSPGSAILPRGFIDAVDQTEGGGNYSTLYGHSQRSGGRFAGVDVSRMTIGEAIQFASPSGAYGQWVKAELRRQGHKPRVATPMGRFQIVGSTLETAAEELGLDPSTPFNAQTQELIATHLAKKRLAGQSTMEGKISALREEWHGFRNVSRNTMEGIVRDLEATDEPTLLASLEGAPGGLSEGEVGHPVLDALTFDERQKVLASARAEQNRRNSGARAQLEVDEANATTALLADGEYDGERPTLDRYIDVYGPVAGEQKWAAFKGVEEQAGFVLDMKTQSEGAILEQLNAMRPTQEESGDTFATDMQTWERMRDAATSNLAARAEDPAAYVARNFPEVAAAWDNGNRQEYFYRMGAAFDQLGLPDSLRLPLTQKAVNGIQEQLQTITPEQKLDFLVGMRQTMGDLFRPALGQLAKGGMPVEAYLSGLVTQSPAHKQVASNVLRGMEILAEDPSRKPSGEVVDRAFRSAMEGAHRALSPSAADAMNKAATALYIFRGGDPDSATFDDGEYEEALRLVVGGTEDNSDTGIADVGGPVRLGILPGSSLTEHKTILPPGVTGTQFRDWIDTLSEERLLEKANGAPTYDMGDAATVEDIVEEGEFVRVGPSEYIVVMGSDGLPLKAGMTDEHFTVTITAEDIGNALSVGSE